MATEPLCLCLGISSVRVCACSPSSRSIIAPQPYYAVEHQCMGLQCRGGLCCRVRQRITRLLPGASCCRDPPAAYFLASAIVGGRSGSRHTPDAGRSGLSAQHAAAVAGEALLSTSAEPASARSPEAAAPPGRHPSAASMPAAPDPNVDRATADALPPGFSPVQAAAATPQPHFVPAQSLAETVNGTEGTDQPLQRGSASSPRALFPPIDAAAASPEPGFDPAPSLAAMAGLSTPDPWRGGARESAAGRGAAAAMSPARSALAETERSVRARVQVCLLPLTVSW